MELNYIGVGKMDALTVLQCSVFTTDTVIAKLHCNERISLERYYHHDARRKRDSSRFTRYSKLSPLSTGHASIDQVSSVRSHQVRGSIDSTNFLFCSSHVWFPKLCFGDRLGFTVGKRREYTLEESLKRQRLKNLAEGRVTARSPLGASQEFESSVVHDKNMNQGDLDRSIMRECA